MRVQVSLKNSNRAPPCPLAPFGPNGRRIQNAPRHVGREEPKHERASAPVWATARAPVRNRRLAAVTNPAPPGPSGSHGLHVPPHVAVDRQLGQERVLLTSNVKETTKKLKTAKVVPVPLMQIGKNGAFVPNRVAEANSKDVAIVNPTRHVARVPILPRNPSANVFLWDQRPKTKLATQCRVQRGAIGLHGLTVPYHVVRASKLENVTAKQIKPPAGILKWPTVPHANVLVVTPQKANHATKASATHGRLGPYGPSAPCCAAVVPATDRANAQRATGVQG